MVSRKLGAKICSKVRQTSKKPLKYSPKTKKRAKRKNLPLVNARVVLKFCAATAIASMAIQIAAAVGAATLEQHTHTATWQ